jgi:hypothetical protein
VWQSKSSNDDADEGEEQARCGQSSRAWHSGGLMVDALYTLRRSGVGQHDHGPARANLQNNGSQELLGSIMQLSRPWKRRLLTLF